MMPLDPTQPELTFDKSTGKVKDGGLKEVPLLIP